MDTKKMEDRLKETYSNCEAAVFDTTGMGQNFEIRLSTPDLKEMSRVERHQNIMALFKEELNEGEIHALTIKYLNL